MQPLKLIIPGEYWDSQIYSGRLYLFERNGSIRTLDWDRVLNEIPIDQDLRLSLVAGFLRSDFLYGAELFALFQDPDVRGLVQAKFSRLSARHLELDLSAIERYTITRQPNLFPFPHSDTEIYVNQMYVAGPSGLWRASCGRRTKQAISTRIEQLFDSPVLGIAASYGTIAAAAGNEGLFEFPVAVHHSIDTQRLSATTELACEDCNWTYQSIYGSSAAGGFLVDYRRTYYEQSRIEAIGQRRSRPFIERTLDAIIDGQEIFGRAGFTWGVKDKICSASNGRIEVARYIPWQDDRPKRVTPFAAIEALRASSTLVSASAAPFGSVVEYSDCVVVYASDGLSLVIPMEPVNWRIFSRSKHYENQLHVIYDDHLEVLSFNHDYLIDQKDKVMGTSVNVEDSKNAIVLQELMTARGTS